MLSVFVFPCLLCTAGCAVSFGELESVKPAAFLLAKIPKAPLIRLDSANRRPNEVPSGNDAQRIKTQMTKPNIREEKQTPKQENEPVKSSTIQTSEPHIQSDQQNNPKTSLAENEVQRNLFNQLNRHKTATPMSSMAGEVERHNVLTDSVTSTNKLIQQTVAVDSHEKSKNNAKKPTNIPKPTTNASGYALLSLNETKDIYRKLDQLNMTLNKKSEQFSKRMDNFEVNMKSKKEGKQPMSAKTVKPRLSHSSLRKSTKKQHVEDPTNKEQKTTNVYNATECPRSQSVTNGKMLEPEDRNISATAQYKCLQEFQACREQLTCEANGLWDTDGACMSAQTEWDSPERGIYDVPCNFTYGTAITILATPFKPPAHSTRCAFNYRQGDKDILLYITAWVEYEELDRYSRQGYTWREHEKDSGKDIFHIGKEFNLTIVYGRDEYKAYVDGEHVFDYKHRIKSFPENFGIYGHMNVRKVLFSM